MLLAREWLGKRPILVFDETLSMLDTKAVEAFGATLSDLGDRATVIIIGHDATLAALADRQLVLTSEGIQTAV